MTVSAGAHAPHEPCHRCQAAIEQGDLRCCICGTAVPRESQGPQQTEVEILRCDGCGAAVSYDVAAQAPCCGFCGSVMHVEKVEDPLEQTEWWGDFRVDVQHADAALSKWFGGLSFLRPSDLSSRATIEGLKPLWWVAWVFDATACVSWTADSNAGSHRSSWAPHAGSTELTFDQILVTASRGLSAKETTELLRGYDLSSGRNVAPTSEDGVVEQFDVQRSEARGRIIDAATAVAASRIEAGHIPGSSFRNINVELVLRGLRTRRCAFPAYVLAYRYRNNLYRAVINGQDASCVTGKAPYSVWKILFLILGGIALLAVIAALVTSS